MSIMISIGSVTCDKLMYMAPGSNSKDDHQALAVCCTILQDILAHRFFNNLERYHGCDTTDRHWPSARAFTLRMQGAGRLVLHVKKACWPGMLARTSYLSALKKNKAPLHLCL